MNLGPQKPKFFTHQYYRPLASLGTPHLLLAFMWDVDTGGQQVAAGVTMVCGVDDIFS